MLIGPLRLKLTGRHPEDSLIVLLEEGNAAASLCRGSIADAGCAATAILYLGEMGAIGEIRSAGGKMSLMRTSRSATC